ncbi:response regulator transcription factor [Vibrio sp. CyArs1]|uniref:response regulator n=1 Tax=Vibrio sp. CyArs1 TaxID=2682577 RepID=UPI001F06EF93|nr:response regulator transcription factor [Vibrio sp. CyArs1]
MARVIIADDHSLVSEGVKRIIGEIHRVIYIANNGIDLIRNVRTFSPEVIICDVSMPMMNGYIAAEQILKASQKSKIIFLTMHTEEKYVQKAFDIGALGYITKRSAPNELLKAISLVCEGKTYMSPDIEIDLVSGKRNEVVHSYEILTPRQKQVLQLICEGYSAREVSALLNVSKRTIEFHKYRIVEILGLSSPTELIPYAIRNVLGLEES